MSSRIPLQFGVGPEDDINIAKKLAHHFYNCSASEDECEVCQVYGIIIELFDLPAVRNFVKG